MEEFNKSARLIKSLDAMVTTTPHKLMNAFSEVASVKGYLSERVKALKL